MIQMIEFHQGCFCIASAARPRWTRTQGQSSIEFDFCERGTIPVIHRRQLMYFIDAVDPVRSTQIFDLILELFNAHTRIGSVSLDLFYSTCERLKLSGSSDVEIEFASGAIEGARGEEYISLSFRKRRLD